MNIEEINFESEAQAYAPIESGEVYYYSMINTGINTRKKCTADFKTWVSNYNHLDQKTVMITGAPPVENTADYTLLHHIEDFVKLPPVQEEIVEAE